MSMTEATEEFGKMLRWAEQPKDAAQAEKTVFIGTVVQGFYVAKRTGVGQNDSTVYEILLADGQKYAFWGSGLLDGKFQDIPMNCEVRVTCLGETQPKTPSGRPYMNFKVEFDKDSVKPATLVEAAPAQGAAVAAAPAAAAPAPTAAPVAAPVAAPTAAPTAAPVAAPVAEAPAAAPEAPAAPAAPAGDGF